MIRVKEADSDRPHAGFRRLLQQIIQPVGPVGQIQCPVAFEQSFHCRKQFGQGQGFFRPGRLFIVRMAILFIRNKVRRIADDD